MKGNNMTTARKRCIASLLLLIMAFGMTSTAYAAEAAGNDEFETAIGSELLDGASESQGAEEDDTSDLPEDNTTSGNMQTYEISPEDIPVLFSIEDDGIATIAEPELTGSPTAFANLTLPSGGIDIPAQGYVQHKRILPLYSLYLRNQPGYANNYYVAYCIEPGVELANSGGHNATSYTLGNMVDGSGALYRISRDQVKAIGIALLYGQKEIASKKDEQTLRNEKLCRHAATQAIVWEISCGWRSPYPPYTLKNTTLYEAIKPALYLASDVWGTTFYLDGIDDAYLDIQSKMEKHDSIPSFSSSTKKSAPLYELTQDTNGKYSITLTDKNKILSQFTFTNTSNLSFSVNGNKLTITSNSPLSETLIAPVKTVPSLDKQVFFVWEKRELQKLMSCKSDVEYESMPVYFRIKATAPTGSLELTKTTEDGTNLKGWRFGIYSDAGCKDLISGPHTTDATGKILIPDLTAGTVYVKEIGHTESSISDRYICDSSNPQKVNIVSGTKATVSFHNRLNTGNLNLIKETNTGENLGGWQIDLYTDSACRKPITGSPFTTGEDGSVSVLNLPIGTLYAKEREVVDPFWGCDTSVKTIEIKAGETATVIFRNTHYGDIRIQKSMEGEGGVGGWQFQITDSSGTEILGSPFLTDEAGLINTGKLLPGQYCIMELIPENSSYYCTSENPQIVTVKAGQTAEVYFTNGQNAGKIIIEKVNVRGEPLAGARFLLEWSKDGSSWSPVEYSESNKIEEGNCSTSGVQNGCLTSEKDGLLEWNGLHIGLFYRVTELAAPDGYSLLKEPAFEGKLTSDQQTISFRVVNCENFTLPQTGSLSEMFFEISQLICIALCSTMLLYSYFKERK